MFQSEEGRKRQQKIGYDTIRFRASRFLALSFLSLCLYEFPFALAPESTSDRSSFQTSSSSCVRVGVPALWVLSFVFKTKEPRNEAKRIKSNFLSLSLSFFFVFFSPTTEHRQQQSNSFAACLMSSCSLLCGCSSAFSLLAFSSGVTVCVDCNIVNRHQYTRFVPGAYLYASYRPTMFEYCLIRQKPYDCCLIRQHKHLLNTSSA